jgi:membrane protein required for colicin V production
MNWLDIIILICLAIGLVKGLFDGFVKQIVSFLALVVAIFFAGQLADLGRTGLQHWDVFSSLSPGILTAVCYILAFSVIVIIIVLLGKVVNIAIKMTPAQLLNRLLGGLFGVLVWLFSLSIVFNLLAAFDPHSTVISEQTQTKSALYSGTKNAVPTIYPFIKEYFKQ